MQCTKAHWTQYLYMFQTVLNGFLNAHGSRRCTKNISSKDIEVQELLSYDSIAVSVINYTLWL